MEKQDYGSWLTEDLIQLEKDMRRHRDQNELYSDRIEYNTIIHNIMREINLRKNNE
mgnify:CR=1 FL=1|jgi:hypothetical protein|tara:strand:+ start:66 stop:233 length:168 start_codon:yes stop_codon:yes gene_type:complete